MDYERNVGGKMKLLTSDRITCNSKAREHFRLASSIISTPRRLLHIKSASSLVPRPFHINCVRGEKGPGTHCFADITLWYDFL